MSDRCQPIPIKGEYRLSHDIYSRMSDIAGKAGELHVLETCDLTNAYGISAEAAKDVFTGSASTVGAKLRELESGEKSAPVLDSAVVDGYVRQMEARLSTYDTSKGAEDISEWATKTASIFRLTAEKLALTSRGIEGEYAAISSRLSEASTAASEEGISDEEGPRLVKEYTTWLEKTLPGLIDKKVAGLSRMDEMRARSSLRMFVSRSSSSVTMMVSRGSSGTRMDTSRSGSSQRMDSSRGSSSLRMELLRKTSSLRMDLSRRQSALLVTLESRVRESLGENLYMAMRDAGRLISGDERFKTKHQAAYQEIISVLDKELSAGIARLTRDAPTIIADLTRARGASLAEWRRSSESQMTEASAAGRTFETESAQKIRDDSAAIAGSKGSKADKLGKKIAADKATLLEMLEDLGSD
ncbi:MAG: hypothetical protein HN337_02830 [Deltaproteobacteria bacterium]|jgi:hypothetical protein|nr:hypothetical protein [Deltaproteobacteria bacterium]